MTYNADIIKTEQPDFVELYKFESGTDIYRYTSSEQPVFDFLGEFYEPGLIKRSGFNQEKTFKAITVTISANITEPMKGYIANTPIEPTKITIYRAFLNDLSDYRILFRGKIKEINFEDQMMTAHCESESDVFRTKIPNVIYKAFCNHFLFDSGCGLNELIYEISAVITIDGSDLLSPTFATFDDEYFTGGKVVFGTDMRLITNHVSNRITLQFPFDSRLQNNNTVDSYPGCNKNPSTCKNKFNNFDNFLGFPYIPSKNPCLYGIR